MNVKPNECLTESISMNVNPMNVTARARLSVIVHVSVIVKPDRERQHKRETQRTTNSIVWNVIPRNHTWSRTFLLKKTEINSRELTIQLTIPTTTNRPLSEPLRQRRNG